jgi:sugar lactone lactonase YvrE
MREVRLNCALMEVIKNATTGAENYGLEALANEHCQCGENPLWHEDHAMIYWEDIPNGFVFRLDPKTGRIEKIYDGALVGGFTFQADGKLLLFRDHDIALLDDGVARVLTREVPKETGRFNDVIADPEGRVFAGTMGAGGKPTGGLFRVDSDGSVCQLWDGTGCANGMGFTPDGQKFYWTDSTARQIFRFDYDRKTGDLSNRQLFYAAPEDAGTPDGMSVDSAGHVWSAHWDGHALRHLSPDGESLEIIRFPVAKVSSCIFGGENLDELYVTTAGGSAPKGSTTGKDATPSTPDGTLYRLRVHATGQRRFRSRVKI